MRMLETVRPVALLFIGCQRAAPATVASTPSAPERASAIAVQPSPTHATEPPRSEPLASPPPCSPFDWAPRALPALIERGTGEKSTRADRASAAEVLFESECTEAPNGPPPQTSGSKVVDGVAVELRAMTPAGSSGRKWSGNQCTFSLRLADGGGSSVELGSKEIPPFNTINALVRSGSAVWLSVGFNGYTREFPQGGNRIIAIDLCKGAVVWQSKDGMSNGGLLLLDDYLISPYGFTSERRYVYVLDARSGNLVQKLPIIENICPSKSWAPNFHAGDRCDAPGQAVGAATAPRVEDGFLLVDTNTGSSLFHFK